MSIVTRLNVLFVGIAALLLLVATAFTASREYQIAREATVAASQARLLSRPDLQVALYDREEAALEPLLRDFLESPAVTRAIARDGLGEVLARVNDADRPSGPPPGFQALRGSLSAVDTALLAFDESMQPEGLGLWNALGTDKSPLYLTMPVFTSVNPVQSGLQPADFYAALSQPSATSSLRVIGYIQLDISREQLLQAAQPAVKRVFYSGLLLLVLFAGIVVWLTRRISNGLSQLAKLAEEVADGKLSQPITLRAEAEIRDLAQVLNSVVGGFSSFRQESAAGQRLLSMKVQERTSQLSQREEELNRAVREIEQTRNQLQHMSYYDSLTTLPNRRLFTEQLALLLDLNRRNGHTLALLFVNLDNFKRINDSLGHSAGDLTLLEVGRRLARCVRGSDRVGHHVDEEKSIEVSRLGSDEFTVVLNQLDRIESAEAVARRLIDALLEPMHIEGSELMVNASVGIAIAPRDGDDVESLLKAAGIAMHHAKAASREQVLYYDSAMDDVFAGRLELEADLRKAVERGEMALHYQVQVNTTNGAVAGAEALLRWEHPGHGSIPPGRFIPLAEESGMMAELGNWVLEQACRLLVELDEAGLKLPRVAINISAIQFNQDFIARVEEVLRDSGLEPARLELGLGERIMSERDPFVSRGLAALRELGVRLSVDDFGMGESALAYLARYQLDEIRIDRSFVDDCEQDENRARLLIAMVAMAKSLGLDVVAEGVESQEQCRFLIEHGVRFIQGYFFSRPVPPEELRQLLAPWHFLEQVQGIQD